VSAACRLPTVAADVDYISTVGANVTTEFWSFAGRAPDNKENEPFLAFMQANAYTTTSYRTLAFLRTGS
jgi:hypothetical protein